MNRQATKNYVDAAYKAKSKTEYIHNLRLALSHLSADSCTYDILKSWKDKAERHKGRLSNEFFTALCNIDIE